MKILNWTDILSHAVAHENKWACYVSFGLDLGKKEDELIFDFVKNEIKKIYTDEAEFNNVMGSLICDGLFFFDDEQKMYEFYHVFEQELTDSSGIYACTFSPDGTCETENT